MSSRPWVRIPPALLVLADAEHRRAHCAVTAASPTVVVRLHPSAWFRPGMSSSGRTPRLHRGGAGSTPAVSTSRARAAGQRRTTRRSAVPAWSEHRATTTPGGSPKALEGARRASVRRRAGRPPDPLARRSRDREDATPFVRSRGSGGDGATSITSRIPRSSSASPEYMLDVLLDEDDDDSGWRLLILEDTGELLALDTRYRPGRGCRGCSTWSTA